jgi:Leucine-rich repeat (LRR) protein
MLDIFATVLGPPIARFLARQIFGDKTLGNELAGGVIDYAKDKFGDFRKARDVNRKIEDLADSLVEPLAAFAEQEHLDPIRAEQIAKDLLSATTALDLGREIAKAGREPAPLAKAIAAALPPGADSNDQLTGLMVVAFANGLCRIAGSLPEYERGKDQHLFHQLDILLESQASVASDLSSLRGEFSAVAKELQAESHEQASAIDQNEKQYRDALYRFASRVKLLGLEGDRHEAGRELPIETAYVPLQLRPRNTDRSPDHAGYRNEDDPWPGQGISDITWPDVLALLPYVGNRLLVEGIGGSGKTTLLQWTAVEALRTEQRGDGRNRVPPTAERIESICKQGGFRPAAGWNVNASDEKSSQPWFNRVPLLIRLRDHADGRLPSPQELPRLIAKTAMGAPEQWVRRVVNEGRALFLIDGIDEVPGEARDKLAEDIDSYLRDYSGCALIATSRPPAVLDEQWTNLFGPCRVSVERMARPEIEAFVKHWYKSYGIKRGMQVDESAVARLLGQLKARPGLIGLMDTPLLSASICFLNKDRTGELPSSAPELYRQLSRQLVHQLDEDRLRRSGYEALVPPLRGLDPEQKLYLLAELAHLMINNRSATLAVDQALPRITQGLRAIGRENARNPEDVLHALQERSGLLRGSAPETVEFAHNNLRGWLAARAFAENGEHVLPIERAFDLKDFDLPVLSASQSHSKDYRHQLIDECLSFAKKNPRNERAAQIMALRCGQAGAIDEKYRSALDDLIGQILPPQDPGEATWLAELGEAIVPKLAAEPDRRARIDAACVRCLRLIGGSASQDMIVGYIQHTAEGVVDELAQALTPLSIPRLRDYVFAVWRHEKIFWFPYGPARHVTAADLSLVWNEITTAKHICLTGTDIADIEFLRQLGALETLELSHTQVADLEPLRGLTALKNLSFNNTQVANLEPLRGLTALANLSFENTQVADLEPLRDLTQLERLFFNNTQVADIEPLRGLTALEQLFLQNTQVADLEPLRGLTALEYLSVDSIQATDFIPLCGLTALYYLSLDSTNISDLEPLCGLTALQWLYLDNTKITDLEPLRKLTALHCLSLDNTKITDLEPLRDLITLRQLSFSNTPVANLEPLRGLTTLQELLFRNTQVTDLEALRGIAARMMTSDGQLVTFS